MRRCRIAVLIFAFLAAPVFADETLEDYLVEKGLLQDTTQGVQAVDWSQVDRATSEEISRRFPDRVQEIKQLIAARMTYVTSQMKQGAAQACREYQEIKRLSESRLKSGADEASTNETLAVASLRQIISANEEFRAEHFEFAPTLAGLVAEPDSCLTMDFDDSHGRPKVYGYEYAYTRTDADRYRASARPLILGKTGLQAFVINEGGRVVKDLNNTGELESVEVLADLSPNEELVVAFMELILMRAAYPRLVEQQVLPKSLAEFMEGVDSGAGTVHVQPDGTVEQFGYTFRYAVEGNEVLLSARTVSPDVGIRWFANGKRPEGPITMDGIGEIGSILVEDTNRNGRVDADEPQLRP